MSPASKPTPGSTFQPRTSHGSTVFPASSGSRTDTFTPRTSVGRGSAFPMTWCRDDQTESATREVLVVIHRRAFLAGLSAAITGARSVWAQTASVEGFAQWLHMSRREREDALKLCVQRIQTLDPKIHAWVQVAPQ